MSDPFVGEIRMFAGDYAPQGWALCGGQVISIAENEVLFSLIGTTYGGDGTTTFALPDLRGRVLVGQGNGAGLSPRSIGQRFGTETVTLSNNQLPAHQHSFNASKAAAVTDDPSGQLFADTGGDTLYLTPPESPDPQQADERTIAAAGGNQPHNNIMSSLAVNYIIALVGEYPPHN